MNINLVQVCGRITRKPEVKTTKAGSFVTSFGIATNYTTKDKQGEKQTEAEFHTVVAFGKTAQTIGQYCDVGDEIYIQGRLKTKIWEENEIKRSRTEILIDRFELIDLSSDKRNNKLITPNKAYYGGCISIISKTSLLKSAIGEWELCDNLYAGGISATDEVKPVCMFW